MPLCEVPMRDVSVRTVIVVPSSCSIEEAPPICRTLAPAIASIAAAHWRQVRVGVPRQHSSGDLLRALILC
jgi:hypothetical protein